MPARLPALLLHRARVCRGVAGLIEKTTKQTCLETGFRDRYGSAVQLSTQRACTAEEALETMGAYREGSGQTCPFDVLIIDQHMEPAGGAMKGTQLVEVLSKRSYAGPHRLVLAIASGNADNPSDAAYFRACGASIVWPKPYPRPAAMSQSLAMAMES